jgi:predicted acylesterase/phospholipase RssA
MSLRAKGAQLDTNLCTHVGRSQRVLVLQGGGSLGAYEAGAYRALYQHIRKQVGNDENVFDIIAGTSIGAINAALLLNHVLENRRKGKSKRESWDGSDYMLEQFWKEDTSTVTYFENPYLQSWLQYGQLFPPTFNEATRRYYSVKELLATGARNVYSPLPPKMDTKFFDPLNTWHRYSNDPLKSIIKKYWDYDSFPIKTRFEQGEPRLLLVAVDIQKGVVVTFDSYPKIVRNGDEKVDYQWQTSYDDEKDLVIRYNKGISIEHVMASASVPIYYDYTVIEAEKSEVKGDNDHKNQTVKRYFWDGQLLSNTPLRELIGEHKKYWESVLDPEELKREVLTGEIQEQKVPDLEVHIANLWPTEEPDIPQDHDLAVDRKNDLLYHDKTKYDEKVAQFITDYIDLTKSLIKLAKQKGATEDEIRHILKQLGKSSFRTGKPREYEELLKGRFAISRVVRIERKDDPYAISQKWADYSSGSINRLFNQGFEDALTAMDLLGNHR